MPTELLTEPIKQKKEKLLPCIVIYAMIIGRKNYIAGQSTRPDNKYLPVYHTDIKQAKPFTTIEEVNKYKAKIENKQNRVFEMETTKLPASYFKPAKIKQFQ